MEATCSHGITWESECIACSDISFKEHIQHLTTDIDQVVDYLYKSPAMASDPSVTIDLFMTIKRLAILIDEKEGV